MKGLRLYLIGTALVTLVYLTAQYYKPKPTDWTPTYLKEDKVPFGLFILYQELTAIFPEATVKTTRLPVYNTLKDKNFENTNYLLINGDVKIDEYDFKELAKYMNKGNHVLIAAFQLSDFLQDTLNIQLNSVLNPPNKKGTPINFVNPAAKTARDYVFERGLSDQYFSKLDTGRALALGRNNKGDVTFVKYPFGKGALYILPNPQLLCNYSLLHKDGLDYASKLLSHLPAAKTIIFDENNAKGNAEEASVLRVFLKHTPLSWAYYLALAGLLVFVLFEMKRRQRIIPVVEPLKNTSVDFVKVVGKVYYQQRDNGDIARKKISYFLEHLRSAYHLKTTQLDDELLAAVVLRSGVEQELVQQLFKLMNQLDKAAFISDEQLIALNKTIEKFYKQAQ
ncbi:DUF4350 domain-containing protein [Pedobacter africanus]|uniref:DUF4350 domain-containing protein n=1 Tax=Pedobacter africanus TaxID=151894 RepID=A0A1W2BIK2_9SPHI|nr:DUF4350 domain-containing protein [Pedobacter africanus]SMC72590.1 hypothetical protein SAMN04488524_2377 [Pedobacter africanus]